MNISSATSLASTIFDKASRADSALGTRTHRKNDGSGTNPFAKLLTGRPQRTADDPSAARPIVAQHNPIHVKGYATSTASAVSLLGALTGKADDSPLDLAA